MMHCLYNMIIVIVLLNCVVTYQVNNNIRYHIQSNNYYNNQNYYYKQFKSLQLNGKKTSSSSSSSSSIIIIPEFSRIINIQQIPQLKPVLCRLLANDRERSQLSIRLDIPILLYFASNVTLIRKDERSILINGQFEAHLKSGNLFLLHFYYKY